MMIFQAGPNNNLKEVALKILQNGVSTVPIIHSPSEDASNPQLLHLASLSGILKCEENVQLLVCVCVFMCGVVSKTTYAVFLTFLHLTGICRYFRHSSSSLPVLQLPICAIPVGTWVPKIGEPNQQTLTMLRPNASLSVALNLLIQGMHTLKEFQNAFEWSIFSFGLKHHL